jgi:hypothetical protein
MCDIDRTGLYVVILRLAGWGELVLSYPTLDALRETVGVCPLEDDESVTVYHLDSSESTGLRVDPAEWTLGPPDAP